MTTQPTPDGEQFRFIKMQLAGGLDRAHGFVRCVDGIFHVIEGTDDLPVYDENHEVVSFGNVEICVVLYRWEDDDYDGPAGERPVCDDGQIVAVFDDTPAGLLGALARVIAEIAQMT